MNKLDQALHEASRETLKAANEALIRFSVENQRLREALEKIRKQSFGQVCDEYELCYHLSCSASYGAWAISEEALKEGAE